MIFKKLIKKIRDMNRGYTDNDIMSVLQKYQDVLEAERPTAKMIKMTTAEFKAAVALDKQGRLPKPQEEE
jgi:hypothetical protein